MADETRDETTQQAPPLDQATEESPAVNVEEPQVVESTAVEEPGPEPGWLAGGTSPRDADAAGARAAAEGPRPEILAIGAFAGAFVLAQILKRLGGGE